MNLTKSQLQNVAAMANRQVQTSMARGALAAHVRVGAMAPAGRGGGGHAPPSGGNGGGHTPPSGGDHGGGDRGRHGYGPGWGGDGYGRGWGGYFVRDYGVLDWGWSGWNGAYLQPLAPPVPADYNAGFAVGTADGQRAINSAAAQRAAGQPSTCLYADASVSTMSPSWLQGWAAGVRQTGCSVTTSGGLAFWPAPSGIASSIVICPAAALVRSANFFANRR